MFLQQALRITALKKKTAGSQSIFEPEYFEEPPKDRAV